MLNILKKIINNNWKLILIVLLAFLLISTGLNKPFWGHHDWNGAYWGNVARNYVKYGPISTGFGMITNVGNVEASEFVYTFHYSPLYPLTLAIAYSLFGVKEEIARSLSIIFSLITVVFMYKIIREKISDFAAFSGMLLWVINPMFLYFGKMPVHDIYILMFVAIGSYYYFQNKLKLTLLFVVLAQLSCWPGYSIVPAIIIDQLIKNRFSPSKKLLLTVLPFIASSFLVFSSLLIHDFLITGSFFGGGLQEIFFTRMRSVNLISYLKTLSSWMNAYYSPIILFSAFAGFLISIKEKNKMSFILFFLIFALVYPSLFKDASFRHDYLLIYFLPFLSISLVDPSQLV
jgi:4-amino-4-deoxy-L-arabinose transferase-like glycosyltransferase